SEVVAVRRAIEDELEPDTTYHALRTRRAGSRRSTIRSSSPPTAGT
ncbi:MAG: hypothetical protein QOF33_2532, partial [Thermomicrobiales bacterium]|nr:hypothetical protein [Thermomicrobiales bacterium]